MLQLLLAAAAPASAAAAAAAAVATAAAVDAPSAADAAPARSILLLMLLILACFDQKLKRLGHMLNRPWPWCSTKNTWLFLHYLESFPQRKRSIMNK